MKKDKYYRAIIENSELTIEINQLKKNYIQEINKNIKNYNKTYEINLIKNNFENKFQVYIYEIKYNNFKVALQQIKDFLEGKNINIIFDFLKEIIKDIE